MFQLHKVLIEKTAKCVTVHQNVESIQFSKVTAGTNHISLGIAIHEWTSTNRQKSEKRFMHKLFWVTKLSKPYYF